MLVTERNDPPAPPEPRRDTAAAASWMGIMGRIQPFLAAVSSGLAQQIGAFDSEIAPYASYALANQGKQIRPALVGLSGLTQEEPNEDLVRLAIIIEMVHLATLVHDDILDEAEVRRSKPTLAASWGNEISVLLGDCLFAHAVSLAASYPTPEVCRAVARATNQVCSGEIIQTLQRRNPGVSRSDYFKVVGMKTGELFALSCEMGGALLGADPGRRAALREFGMTLGTAYQIHDDCLDLFGSEQSVGKSLGTDLASGKITLPLMIALEKASPADKRSLQGAIEHWQSENFSEIIELLRRCDALNETKRVFQDQIERAQRCLARLGRSEGAVALAEVADFLAQQNHSVGVMR